MGDVYKFVSELVDRARKERGQVYLALYELHDKQLIKLLVDAMKSKLIHIMLTTAGNLNPNPKGTAEEGAAAGRLGHRERRSASAASQSGRQGEGSRDRPDVQFDGANRSQQVCSLCEGRQADRRRASLMAKSHRSSKKTQGPKPIAEADKRQVLYDLGYVIDQLRARIISARREPRISTPNSPQPQSFRRPSTSRKRASKCK